MRANPVVNVNRRRKCVDSSAERKANGKRPYSAPTLKMHPFLDARNNNLIIRIGKKRMKALAGSHIPAMAR